MTKSIFTLLLFTLVNSIYGQECDCETIFNWTKKTFEENDAGFQYIIDKKGISAYALHNELSTNKVKNIETTSKCVEIIKEWLYFFRKSHIDFRYTGKKISQTNNEVKPIKTYNNETIISSPNYKLHLKFLNSNKPFIENINAKTLYLRIPSFGGNEKKSIDSLIAANRNEILSTENLIIDIRNGTGGSDASYRELIPFIYTNPIRLPTVEFFSTPLNNKRMYELSTNTGLALESGVNPTEKEKAKFKAHFDTLNSHLGEFVNLNPYTVKETKLDTIYPYPKQIGILINQNNVSTDEQFILEAKQSKKVKLFGTTTRGGLDVSNLYVAFSPNKDFFLIYALSKSLRIPDMVVDDIGIMPDYYIDREIPKHEWIKYVNDILNE